MSDGMSGKTSGGDLPEPKYEGGDDETLNRHLQQAADAGIDALACAWKGPSDTASNGTTARCKRLLELAAASGGKVKVALFADEANTASFTNKPDAMVQAIQFLKSDFMSSSAYYTIQGKPVLLAWRAEQLGAPAAWQSVREQADPNREMFWMGGTIDFSYLDAFDSLFFFNITWEAKAGGAMGSYRNKLNLYNKQHPGRNVPFVGTAEPGYDDTAYRAGTKRTVPIATTTAAPGRP